MALPLPVALSLALSAAQAPTSSPAPASARTTAPPLLTEDDAPKPFSPHPDVTKVPLPRFDDDAPTGRGRPPEPRWRGTGLIAAASVLGAFGLGFNIARIAVGRGLCHDLRYDEDTQSVEGQNECLNGGFALGGLAIGALVMNGAAFGLAAGAGVQRGRWKAHRVRFAGDREPSAKLQIGLGAGLLAAGIVGYLVTRVASYVDVLGQQTCSERYPIDDFGDPMTRANVNQFSRCMGGRISGYLSGITVTQTMSIVGVGLLTHGAAYRRDRKLMQYISSGRLRLQPSLGRSFVGLTLGGRF